MFIMTQIDGQHVDIHRHIDFNNLLRPNHQGEYSSFGGLSEKLENYVTDKQYIINKEKTLQSTALIDKSKLAKPFTKIHHATSTYYNFPVGYEHAEI